MKQFTKQTVRQVVSLLILSFAFTTLATIAGPQKAESATRATFEFTCETSEDEFYDWIEAELWPKGTSGTFGRNLDATYDILTDVDSRRANWEITLTATSCLMDPAAELRRESLYETIEDAHAAGHGRVLRSL